MSEITGSINGERFVDILYHCALIKMNIDPITNHRKMIDKFTFYRLIGDVSDECHLFELPTCTNITVVHENGTPMVHATFLLMCSRCVHVDDQYVVEFAMPFEAYRPLT